MLLHPVLADKSNSHHRRCGMKSPTPIHSEISMLRIWYNNIVDTQRRIVEVEGDLVRIGRGPENDLVLHSPYIAEHAAVLKRNGDGWEVLALGMNGLNLSGGAVKDQHLSAGQRITVSSSISIELFPYTLTLDVPRAQATTLEAERLRLEGKVSRMLAEIHRELLDRMELRRGIEPNKQNDQQFQLSLERHLETIAHDHPSFIGGDGLVINHLAGSAVRDQVLKILATSKASAGKPVPPSGDLVQPAEDTDFHQETSALQAWSRIVTAVPERERELESTAAYLARGLTSKSGNNDSLTTELVDREYWPAWKELSPRIHSELKQYLALRKVIKEIKDIVFGYGPLEDLLRMPDITEIMVVSRDRIFVESAGVIENSGRQFFSDEIVESIIQRIVGKVGRRIDRSQPLVDARLADGSRVNAVIAPLAVSGPTLTIRKFPARKITIDHLVALGGLPGSVADFLRAIVLSRKNIIVSGGTGTGKTTLLNCLSDFIPDSERIVTVEDTAELQLAKQHVVRLETKIANVEGAGEYTIRDLVRNALRMRPDRVVVGECRGPEALDMLQAMNTGHDGSLTTIHANSAKDVLLRLEVLVQMAADLPVASIRQQIGAAIDVIIQLRRLGDGRRVISQITECVGVHPRSGQLELRDLYALDSAQNSLQPTGSLPTFIAQLLSRGHLQLDTFYGSPSENPPEILSV
jgi:pilus assembly protein CpaF